MLFSQLFILYLSHFIFALMQYLCTPWVIFHFSIVGFFWVVLLDWTNARHYHSSVPLCCIFKAQQGALPCFYRLSLYICCLTSTMTDGGGRGTDGGRPTEVVGAPMGWHWGRGVEGTDDGAWGRRRAAGLGHQLASSSYVVREGSLTPDRKGDLFCF
jgi:hypothetical protein